MKKTTNEHKFKVSGVWSKSPENIARPICLGLLISKPLLINSLKDNPNRKTIAGIAGGYCGGDLFPLEQFVCEIDMPSNKIPNKKSNHPTESIHSLWIGSQDVITGNEVDFNNLPPQILDTCQEALQENWEWNSENNYLESQQLRLYPYNLSGLVKTNAKANAKADHLYYKPITAELKTMWKYLHQHLHLINEAKNIPIEPPTSQPKQNNIHILEK